MAGRLTVTAGKFGTRRMCGQYVLTGFPFDFVQVVSIATFIRMEFMEDPDHGLSQLAFEPGQRLLGLFLDGVARGG
jgi:hypothetical protein